MRTVVLIAKESCYEHVFIRNLNPLKKLIDRSVEQGGKIWVCTLCIRERQITEDMLVEPAEPVTSGRVVQAGMGADTVLSY